MEKRYKFLIPLLMGLMVALGMYLGSKFQPTSKISKNDPVLKVKEVLDAIDASYIDTVKYNELIDESIYGIFDQLDPHSTYIPLREIQDANEQLDGDFEGIGVEFNLLRDTIIVVDVVAAGPSANAGIRQGDKILKINNEIVTGKKFTNKDVIKRLKGAKGSKVKIKIYRAGNKEIPEFIITRATIPISSVAAAYMVSDKVGYIKVTSFAANTYDEFLDAIYKLEKEGLKELILDLSGNPGGYLKTAVNIADEFFGAEKRLVYTRGMHRKNEDYYSTSTGNLKQVRLLVIIDEGSASASEIFAGCIQDYDRGLIIGRRSFGKGLVQEQITLSDKSAIRLTVARYFTPSGRCIQKDYHKNKSDYYNDLLKRFEHGELTSIDSIRFPKEYKYRTTNGRLVYGGGGIMPDIFVPLDTLGNSEYLSELQKQGIIFQYSIYYLDRNLVNLKTTYKSLDVFEKNFNPDMQLYNQFVVFANKAGVKKDPAGIIISKPAILLQFKALMARLLFGYSAYYQVINRENREFIKAVEVIDNNSFWNKINY